MQNVPVSELDRLMAYCDEGYKVSHDEAYRRFNQISLAPPTDLPSDPFSPEYAATYLDLYKRISNRPAYDSANERTLFDVDKLTTRPFPYYTKSFKLAGQHFQLMGQLLDMMDCPSGSDILEFGFGWGNTTMALALLGHNVTAVDIEENFCELVRRRAKNTGVEVDVVHSDFMWAERTGKTFDAVVFFECFHHCWEFPRLLKALHRVLKPGGTIYFGAEPISAEWPVPWGLRLDGESLFVARRSGWMELGFRDDFFAELLKRTGWRGEKIGHHFWRAISAHQLIKPVVILGDDPRLGTHIGARIEGGIRFSYDTANQAPAFVVYGPYIRLPAGSYEASIEIDDAVGMVGSHLDAVAEHGTLALGGRTVEVAEGAGPYRLSFTLETAAAAIEVRLQIPGGASGFIRRITIEERQQ